MLPSRRLFTLLGICHLAMGAIHLVWMFALEHDAHAFPGFSPAYRHLALLCVGAVGLFLFGWGVLAMGFATARRHRERSASVFALVTAVLWFGRGLLELRHPVLVSMLGLSGLHGVILLGCGIIALLAIAAGLFAGPMGTSCAVPASHLFDEHPLQVHYQDAYEISLPADTRLDQVLVRMCIAPRRLHALMWLRDALLAGPFHLPRRYPEFRRGIAAGQLFPMLAECHNERLMGAPDKHLSFQVLVQIEGRKGSACFRLATRVHFHGRVGRLYFIPVRIVHRWLVPKMLGRAASDPL